jgi:hypothetical protein
MENVFEPMENFDGEVFEPMANFDDDYSNFGLGWFKKKDKSTTTTSTQSSPVDPNAGKPVAPVVEPKKERKPVDWGKIGTAIKTGADTLSTLAPVFSKPEFQRNLEAVCGSSGQVFGIGKPRQSYLTCAENYMKTQGVNNQQFQQWQSNLSNDNANTSSAPTGGLSMGAKIGIGVGALAVVGLVVFLVVGGKGKGKGRK